MKPSTISILSVPLLAAGAIALSGCGKSGTPTTITYHQIGICKSYVTAGTPQQPNAGEGFAIFKVESIDNSKNGSAFYFDPVRFYVNQSTAETKGNIYKRDQRFMNADSRIGPALGVKYVDKITVPKGEKVDDVGFFLIPLGLNNPSGGPEADKWNFDVTFDTGSGERGGFERPARGIEKDLGCAGMFRPEVGTFGVNFKHLRRGITARPLDVVGSQSVGVRVFGFPDVIKVNLH